MRRTIIILSLTWALPVVSLAQAPVNADSIEVYGLLLIGGIDKFEYGSAERLVMTLQVVNNTDGVIIPRPVPMCPLTFIDEAWCRPDSSDCQAFTASECVSEGTVGIPPGITTVHPTTLNEFWPGPGNWEHSLGRVRFWDPWGEPWTGGSAFELSVNYHRSPLLAVEPTAWGRVKALYR